MKPIRWGAALAGLAVMTAAVSTGCSRHYVVVTPPEDGYTRQDTLYGRMVDDDREIRVTFWFDTIYRTVTEIQVDTLWREGARVDTVLRVDSVKVLVADTLVRTDTVRVRNDALRRPAAIERVDTVRVTDTLKVTVRDTVVRVDTVSTTNTVIRTDTVLRVDTVRVSTTETVVDTVTRVDTVRIATTDTVTRVDTVRVVTTDTVIRTDTVRVGGGPRHVFVPPGHYPPEGQCRVWIEGRPPGRQASPAPCDQLGDIPAPAFILFAGVVWDYRWDWVAVAEANPGAVPPEIVALSRQRDG